MCLVSRLLAHVHPRCKFCVSPATKFKGTLYDGKASDTYLCDTCHAYGGGKIAKRWTDLPGAMTIREAIMAIATGAT